MPFAAALSTTADSTMAIAEVCARALQQLQGTPELALLFFSPHHAPSAVEIAATAQEQLNARCFLGCGGESIVGNDQEIEAQPAMSLWLGRWNGAAEMEPFHLVLENTPDGPSLLGWPDGLVGGEVGERVVLTLGDPYSFPADFFLEQINEQYPGLRVIGGMSSAVRGPGECQLILNGQVHDQGAIGVLLKDPIKVRSIVSQGCRPIGRHLVVTKARGNIILELGGKAPLVQLQQLWHELNSRDQQLFQQGLHIGSVINEYQEDFQRGDFLVRNVMGLDRRTGALQITDQVRVGQTVQFHVRDAESADEDLHFLLQHDRQAHPDRAGGALLFTCNGRGTRLFAEPHHDAQTIRAEAGELPLAGFFAAGELGPIGGQNFIHGFTASVALFE